MNDDELATFLTQRGEAIYYDSSKNTHAYEWEEDYLGVSTLVKQSALDYARRLIKKEPEAEDRESGLWSFIGNNLADAYLRTFTPFREVQVRLNLGPFELVGHLDGLELVDGGIVIHENKAYAGPSDSNVELAERQAYLYAAMMSRQMAAGSLTFPLADFQTDPTAEPLHLTGPVPIRAICINISSRNGPPALVSPRIIRDGDLQAILEFYTKKAQAIWNSYETGDESYAIAWDSSPEGLQEFKRPMTATQAGLDNEELGIASLEYENAKREEQKWAAIKKERSGTVSALLRRSGEKRVTLEVEPDNSFSVTLVEKANGSAYPNVNCNFTDDALGSAIATMASKLHGGAE